VICRAGVIVSIALATPAFADPAPAPDPRAVEAAEDANLVSNAPRTGTVLAFAVGGGIVLGGNGAGDTGVGRGPSLSFRVGHVATRDTVITFELTGGSRLHEAAVSGSALLHDDDYNLMAGALVYVLPSVWLRGAGGLSVITFESTMGTTPHAGVAGLGGVGVDIARWRQLVLGIEGWGLTSVVGARGVVFDSGLCLGLTYY
jgi:hypothetical protein